MNDRLKLIAGIFVFGSLWGVSEALIAPGIKNAGLPDGAIMTGIFAMFFLAMSRILYQQKGMQLGMGLVAGSLRALGPLGGCQICSAIAIMAEGFVFELIWNYVSSIDLRNIRNLTLTISLGIFTAYSVFVVGYMVTQITTPLLYAGFYLENFISMLPQYLARGLPAALIGGVTIPFVLSLSKLDLSIKDKLYYPITVSVSAICWILVISVVFFTGA